MGAHYLEAALTLLGERHHSREHLVEHNTHRVDVRSWTDIFALHLLRAHVLVSTDGCTCPRHLLAPHCLCDAKVDDYRTVVRGDQDIARFDVTMDDGVIERVDVSQAIEHLLSHCYGSVNRERAFF